MHGWPKFEALYAILQCAYLMKRHTFGVHDNLSSPKVGPLSMVAFFVLWPPDTFDASIRKA